MFTPSELASVIEGDDLAKQAMFAAALDDFIKTKLREHVRDLCDRERIDAAPVITTVLGFPVFKRDVDSIRRGGDLRQIVWSRVRRAMLLERYDWHEDYVAKLGSYIRSNTHIVLWEGLRVVAIDSHHMVVVNTPAAQRGDKPCFATSLLVDCDPALIKVHAMPEIQI